MKTKPIRLHVDYLDIVDHGSLKGYVEIEGIKYSHGLFKRLGGLFAVGNVFEVVDRENGVICLQQIDKELLK